jgi:SpoVK/Ycf46/Vps4 family AAA+-type ATPase
LDCQDDGQSIRLADVEGNEGAKRALEQAVIYPTINPRLFTGNFSTK